MIFLCFSGKDRLTVVSSILFHLKNHGVCIWFDNHEYILGDSKAEKYTAAIKSSDYAIVFISKDFFNSMGAIEELEVIKEMHNNSLIHVFPIFYNIEASELPDEYKWLTSLIYNEIVNNSGTLSICNQIVSKLYADVIIRNCYLPLEAYLNNSIYLINTYIKKLLNLYISVSASNLNSRMSILFSLIIYLQDEIQGDIYPLCKSASYLFNTTRLDISYNFKEIILLEQISIILLGIYIGDFIEY